MKTLIVLALIAALAVPLAADDRQTFRAVAFTLGISTFVDYAVTTNALQTGRFAEGNPLARPFVGKPVLALPIVTGAALALTFGLDALHVQSRTAGWIVAGLLFAVKGYIIYRNVRLLREVK